MTKPAYLDENERLAALHAYGILDTPPEVAFEHLTSMVTRLFRVPIVAIVLLDAERRWFKSVRGFEARETPRELSFCTHALESTEVLVVPDTKLDSHFADHPFVAGEPFVRFYAGAPLRSPEGHTLGALCMADCEPRDLTAAEQQLLAELATLTEDELLLRRVAKELSVKTAQQQNTQATLDRERQERPADAVAAISPDPFRQLVDHASDALFVYDIQGCFVDVNATACVMVGYAREELLRLRVGDIEVSFDPLKAPERWRELVPGEAITMEGLSRRKDGGLFPTEARISAVDTVSGRLLLALVRDISERKQAEKLLQRRAGQQQAIAKLSARVLSETSNESLLDETVKIIAGTLGIEICRIYEHSAERGELVTRAEVNFPGAEPGPRILTDRPSFAVGYALGRDEPVLVDDARADQRFEVVPWLKAQGAVSGLNVTIGGDGSHLPTYGVLSVYTRSRRPFTEDDVYFVQSVANILATSIARQRAVDALREVEARYQRIATNTPGVVYQYMRRPDGTLTIPFISESYRMFYGRSPAEVQAEPNLVVDSIYADDRPGFEVKIRVAETTLTALHWQGRHLLPSGEVRWVRFDSRPEQLVDGSVICDGIIIDVTEEEQRKEALRQSEERFRLANVHAPFPIMLHTEDGEVIQVNDAWTHISGYSSDELATMEDWLRLAYSSEEERDQVRRFLDKVWQRTGAVENPGRRIRCAGGEERIWDVSGVNLGRLPDGRWLRLSTAIDVTEQRRHEEALREAKEEAERANLTKSRFLSRMSHELRTPLNAILGFGQVLELSQLGKQDDQAVQQILAGGRHLLSMIDEVLDLARVEAGELGLKISPVPLDILLPECAGLVTRMAEARGITCTIEFSTAYHRSVMADEQRLRQIVLNLLSNAIKYNREGGQISLRCEASTPDRVRLKISDTGPGITSEGLARLFVPFERLGQEHGEVEGTGLGLVVSRELTRAMDGCLSAESQLGHGSTFWVELPLAANLPSPSPADATPSVPPTTPVPPASATLLYIEDNPSNVQVIKTVIERLRPHWQFLSAKDRPSGLKQAREFRPDIILLDLQLPGMNGDEVLAELRGDRVTRDTAVLLLSADATVHSRERLLALGATDYVSKPFHVVNLLEKLDALFLSFRG